MAGKADGRCRRSAEARDSTDGLPLTVRERSFVLRPPDGKVCPEADLVWLGMKVGAGKARRLVDRGPATTLCEAVDVWGEPGGRNRFSIARLSTASASGRTTMIRRSQKLSIARNTQSTHNRTATDNNVLRVVWPSPRFTPSTSARATSGASRRHTASSAMAS